MEFYELALLSVWTLGVCSIFYIKSQLKVKDRALHDFVFGQSFTEYSSANSIRFLKIACSPKNGLYLTENSGWRLVSIW